MRNPFLPTFAMLVACVTATAAEPIKVWNYSKATDLAQIVAWSKEPGLLVRNVSADVKTPDGKPTLELTLKAQPPEGNPTHIQLIVGYEGGLKAGQDYELSFLCKASEPGEVQVVVTLHGEPWTRVPGAETKIKIAGTDWQTVTMRFSANMDWTEPMSVPRIFFGTYGAEAILHLGQISLRQVTAKTKP